MLDPLIIAALVELLYVIVSTLAPQFPISRELIQAIVVALLGLFTYRALVKPVVRKFLPGAEARGLIGKE